MAMRQDASTGELVDDNKNQNGDPKSAGAIDPKKATIDIKVYAPFKVYFEGKAHSISALNDTGPFDILPGHHNFLTMLLSGPLIIKTPYDTQTINIARGLMHVKSNSVVVYLDV